MELFAPDRPIGTENVSAYTNPGFIFVGEYTTEHRSIGTGRSLTVVVPGAVYQPGLALDQRLADLEHAGALLDNGSTADRNSVLFVLPTVREDADDVIRREWLRSMGASKTHFTYIRESARPGGWVHEFTHVALEFDTTPRMRWLREASATYTGQYVTLQRGYWPRSEFRDRLNAHRGADGVLGNQSTWTRLTPYRKGAVVLAYLDQRIREETDGDRTIFAVFRRLNGEEVVTYSEFKQAVASVVGDHRLDAEIDRYVLTGANPANHEYLYVVGEDPGIP